MACQWGLGVCEGHDKLSNLGSVGKVELKGLLVDWVGVERKGRARNDSEVAD